MQDGKEEVKGMVTRDIKTRDGMRQENKEKRRNKFPVWMES